MSENKSTRTPIQLPLPIEGETIEIPLTKGYTAIVDAMDADLTQYKWTAQETKHGTVYAYRQIHPVNRRKTGQSSIKVYLHRVIAERIYGIEAMDRMLIDHRDSNGCNNRRGNLRIATRQQNNANKRVSPRNKTGLKGVVYDPETRKWIAYIRIEGRSVNLGYYASPREAHEAYKRTAIEYFGEFARFE